MRIEEKEYTKSIDISIWKKVFPFLAPRKNVLIQDISTGESYRGNSLRIRKRSQRFRETYFRHLTGWKRFADRR